MGRDQHGAKAGQLFVVREFLATVVLFGRVTGDFDQQNGIDDGEHIIGRALGPAADDRDVRVRREAGGWNPDPQVRREGTIARESCGPSKPIIAAASAAWSGDPPAIA